MVFAPICTYMNSAKPQTGHVGRSRPSIRVGTSRVPSRGQNVSVATAAGWRRGSTPPCETILQKVDAVVRRRIGAVQECDIKGHVVGEKDHLQDLGEHVPSGELQ